MDTDRDFIGEVIKRAALEETDQKLWEEIFKFAQEKHLRAIRQALEVDQKLIHDFTRIFKKQIRAIANSDENVWYEALTEEQEIIKKYLA